jgi:dTDP-4-amino-4,6-dideoxygalactose transaminase
VYSSRPAPRHPVPVAEAAAKRAVALPLYPDLSAEQVDHVADLIRDFTDPRRPR